MQHCVSLDACFHFLCENLVLMCGQHTGYDHAHNATHVKNDPCTKCCMPHVFEEDLCYNACISSFIRVILAAMKSSIKTLALRYDSELQLMLIESFAQIIMSFNYDCILYLYTCCCDLTTWSALVSDVELLEEDMLGSHRFLQRHKELINQGQVSPVYKE